jgi:hypothetical protein
VAIAPSGSDAAVTPGPDGTWGVTSTRYVTGTPYEADRVFLRTVAPK